MRLVWFKNARDQQISRSNVGVRLCVYVCVCVRMEEAP